MNLGTIETAIYAYFGHGSTSTVQTDVRDRIRQGINEDHRHILTKKGMKSLRKALLTFASVANSPFAVLPQAMSKVIAVSDRINGKALIEATLQEIRIADPGLTSVASYPDQYFIDNYASYVAQDPTDASAIFAKSTSATDGATKTAFIEGIVTGGYYQTSSVVLNGVTAVQFGALATWILITKFYIGLTAGGATTATGNVTLHEDSGIGTEMARIPPGRDKPRYTRIHLYPTPTAANTYYADGLIHVEDLANYTDEPLLPEDFHDILIIGAKRREYSKREKVALFKIQDDQWKSRIAELRDWLVSPSGIAYSEERRRRYSQLGSYFEAGS